MHKKRGQSTLEYIVLFAVIVAAVLAFTWLRMRPAVDRVMQSSADRITDAADNFDPTPNPAPAP